MSHNPKTCVAIARDVLLQLKAKRFIATTGTYVRTSHISEVDYERSFKTFFKENKDVTCEVCALGAAFVSIVNINNKCSVEDILYDDGQMFDRIEEYFGSLNAAMMESAFERIVMTSFRNTNDNSIINQLRMAAAWGRQYDDPTERMRAIMNNIIRNKGNFKLPKKMMKRINKEVFNG